MTPRGSTLAVVAALARRQRGGRGKNLFVICRRNIRRESGTHVRGGNGYLRVNTPPYLLARRRSVKSPPDNADRCSDIRHRDGIISAPVAAQKSDTSMAQLRPTYVTGRSDNYRHDNNATD